MKTFRDRLYWLVEQKAGGNQAAFASKAGVSTPAMSNYLKGHREPSADKLFQIASAGGVTVQWLKTGKGPRDDYASIIKADVEVAREMKDKVDPEQVIYDLQNERRRTATLEAEIESLKAQLDRLKKIALEAGDLLKLIA